ncbi:MAG: serine/threonine-protein kinase [Verrucomicrobiota bacterium]|nr:serine/threonine-protein kinase [Verrucomicrobiota bacterium]
MPLFKRKKKESKKDIKAKKLETPVFCAMITEGIYPCYFCGEIIMLKKMEPLSFCPCPHCNAANFIPKKIGDYFLYRPLGGGGMGSVYKALSLKKPNGVFAIKILARDLRDNKHLIDKVLEEAKIVRNIKGHLNCVKYVGHGFYKDEFFFAMEYIPGKRLDRILSNEGSLSELVSLRLIIQLTSADAHIYDCGYLYRDIKPENIIITPEDRTMIFDFGLAIPRDEAKNNPSEIVEGSPHYIPPERLVGLGETPASEIYSLGMLFYQIISGKTFFINKNKNELAETHVTDLRKETVEQKLPGINEHIARIIDAMIVKKPTERIQSFSKLLVELKKVYTEVTGRKYID